MSIVLLWVLAQVAPAVPQDPARPALSKEAVRDLRSNNIFSPLRPKRASVRSKEPASPVPPARPKPPVLTGIIFEAEKGVYRALAEDRNRGSLRLFEKPAYVEAGDDFKGYHIEYVTVDRLGVRHGETTWALRVGDSFPDIGAEAPEGSLSESTSESSSEPGGAIDEGRRKSVLEALRERLKKKRSE